MERITGQVYVRDHGEAPTKDGRRLMSLTMLVAVPTNYPLKTEHQYTVIGSLDNFLKQETIVITVHPQTAIDHGKDLLGYGLDGIVQSPIWRC